MGHAPYYDFGRTSQVLCFRSYRRVLPHRPAIRQTGVHTAMAKDVLIMTRLHNLFVLRHNTVTRLLSESVLLVAALLAGGGELAADSMIYDNGGTTYNLGFEMSSYQEADDFSLPSLGTITGATFWTTEGYGIRPNAKPFDGHIDYWIYPSVNGLPGSTALANGTATIVSRTARGLQQKWWGSMYAFEYDINLAQPVVVQANTSYAKGDNCSRLLCRRRSHADGPQLAVHHVAVDEHDLLPSGG
jgi:hypothetical protein